MFGATIFPHDLKFADVAPIYKKKSKASKDNYRPVSILSNISKVYERCIYDQIQTYFDKILSKYQCGFRKGYNSQHCLIALIEKWKKSVDNGGAFGALLTDLSKAFDCVTHELLIAKLHAYGFDKRSLVLIHNYLFNRKQRVKVNDSHSSWSEILFGVPQGSIFGPSLYNIFVRDMFYFMENFEIANYAYDSTPITTDSNLSFNKHINNLCKKASIKLNALARISGYMDLPKCRVIMKSFITSQFGYSTLIWMFHSRVLNNKHYIKIILNNLQVLAIEMFKIKNNMAPEFLNEIFQNRALLYNLRTNSNFSSRQVHSVYHGTESLSFLGPKIWELVPEDTKQSESLKIFKNKIKKWVPSRFPCRLCHIYLQKKGFQ